MRIADRQIGRPRDVYIIAELGVNHDGSVDRALQLVDAAASAGADAIKLQHFQTDLLMSRASKLAAYQKAAGETDPLEMLHRLELSVDQMAPVVERAHARGLHAIVTVFSVELVAEAERLAWDAYKTASPDIINKPLLDALAATGKPLIVSTGASTLDEVKRAVAWLGPARDRLATLQCVSSYPTPPGQEELGGIRALSDACGLCAGYSDHTSATETGAAAVAAGARILEKHLTYNRAGTGPDHRASLDPSAMHEYVELARSRRAAVPSRGLVIQKRVLPIEEDVRRVSRQSLTTRGALAAGHTLTLADLTIKRPGIGIEPWRLDDVIGRRTSRAVEADTPLSDADLEARR